MRFLVVFMMVVFPLLLANRGCDQTSVVKHPAIEAATVCSDCHDDGRSRETKPAGHDVAWERQHGKWIQQVGFKTDGTCAVCHRESWCQSCHRQEKPRDHTEFFRLKGHGLSVGLDRSKCMTCHRSSDFCQRCHTQTQPVDHRASFGAPTNRHCLSCHFPLTSAGAEKCATCHTGTPSHAAAPALLANAIHVTGADCRSCHIPLRHPDNGMSCTTCHSR